LSAPREKISAVIPPSGQDNGMRDARTPGGREEASVPSAPAPVFRLRHIVQPGTINIHIQRNGPLAGIQS